MCDRHSVPKVFISLRLLLFRHKVTSRNPTFPFIFLSFSLQRKTHPVSFRNERHILYPNYTLRVFQNNSFWVGKVYFLFFTMVHTFSFIDVAEYCWKPKLYPSYSFSFILKRRTLLLPQYNIFVICLYFFGVSYFLNTIYHL